MKPEFAGSKETNGRTAPLPCNDAYLIALQLRACPDHDLYFDGRLTKPKTMRKA